VAKKERFLTVKYSGRTATAIIEFPQHMILLIKRDTVPFKGYWALPGGRAEQGETVEQTIIREVKEETGLDVAIVRKIGEYHEEGTLDGVEYDYYPACFLVKVVGGEMKRQESEIQEIQLFSLKDIPETLAFVHNLMVSDYVAQKIQLKGFL
jgi:8-oxo-dGTP diphosphatase